MKKIIKGLKWIVGILFVVVSIIIILYPVKNQDIKIYIDTSKEDYTFELSSSEISNLTEFEVQTPEFEFENLNEIRFYRLFKTICVGKIAQSDFVYYADIRRNGEVIYFNSKTCEIIKEFSQTFLMERLFFISMLICLALFLWILINAFEERVDPYNRNNHGPIYEMKRFVFDIKKYGQYMVYSANCDLKAEVANSYLNRLWWLLEPFFNMLVYVIVFGRIMGRSIVSVKQLIIALNVLEQIEILLQKFMCQSKYCLSRTCF